MTGKDMLRTAALAGLGLIGFGLWTLGPLLAEARIGAAYAARQTCACHHLGQRPLDACIADLPGAGAGATIAQGDNAVRASLFGGLISAKAVYEEGYGCFLE